MAGLLEAAGREMCELWVALGGGVGQGFTDIQLILNPLTYWAQNLGDEVSLESRGPESVLPLLPIRWLHLELPTNVLQGLVADVYATVGTRGAVSGRGNQAEK